MRTSRYDTSGQWYKGNTHLHSTASDGGMELAEIATLYASAGYDFLVATDHHVPSCLEHLAATSPLLWLDGIELDGRDEAGSFYHVACIGKVNGITRETPFPDAMRIARECNATLILAHPFWTGNTLEDAERWDFDGVEIYNHVCHWLNGKSDGLIHWNAMLRNNPNILALAVDDAHLKPEHPGWGGGWIVVNAEECSESALLGAIRSGNYYSSCGPEFHTIEVDGDSVRITTSPVQYVRLVGPGCVGQRLGSFDRQDEITDVSLPLQDGWEYTYVEIEDSAGKRAWTNTLFS